MSDFWLREVIVLGCGREFRYPDYEVQFHVDFAKGGDPDVATVELYNLTPETEQIFQDNECLTLSAGYQGDIGIIMMGEIKHVRAFDEGVDRICEIEIHDTSEDYQGKLISESYVPGTRASEIIARMISLSGLEPGEIILPDDLAYTEGRTVDGTIREILADIAEDCGAEIHITHGTIYLLPPGTGHDEAILLTSGTGLIGSPKRIDDESNDDLLWEVESLLNYRIRAGSLVQLESKHVTGLFSVESGSHINDGAEFKTVIQLTEPCTEVK